MSLFFTVGGPSETLPGVSDDLSGASALENVLEKLVEPLGGGGAKGVAAPVENV
ncbi:hypothetical protein ACFSHT_11880 [Paraburkholderia silviterrae]|uniref:hypothetical protein n=1 Tax=Paraburkholderia silviterrae TaxID=2528715 RepID=UPI0014055837|nr:hypothetical protein [Paraburkholderia silviterrae]